MSIDLDAIQARANHAAFAITEAEYARRYQIGASDHHLKTIQKSAEDTPSLISLVRELQAGIPARVVLDGDPEEIEAALDALPDRAVVTCDAINEQSVWIRTAPGQWHGSGLVMAKSSRYLARYCSPLMVVR